MTYNEWRDELKNNLLSVSDAERMRVLDYYAEAYADRREAGFTEREIISDFGAPYDAAQRILYGEDGTYDTRRTPQYDDNRASRAERNNTMRTDRHDSRQESPYREDYYYYSQPQPRPQPQPQPQNTANTARKREDFTWVFVLLCIVFAIPLFVLVVVMVSVTFSLCVAPFGVLISGIVRICAGIGALFTSVSGGFVQIGIGLIQTGVGLALIPLFIWLVRQMWKLFKSFFRWVRQLFSGKEDVQ